MLFDICSGQIVPKVGKVIFISQVRFRRHYRRKVGPNDPDVVTIQDLRDVVLFSIPPQQLSSECIRYFHTPSMDFLLRSLIIYFQFFMQVNITDSRTLDS